VRFVAEVSNVYQGNEMHVTHGSGKKLHHDVNVICR